jgi:hypothetical protein
VITASIENNLLSFVLGLECYNIPPTSSYKDDIYFLAGQKCNLIYNEKLKIKQIIEIVKGSKPSDLSKWLKENLTNYE